VGYAGGKKENPTYHSLGDHTETLEIDFDPEKISYAELLAIFWDSHNPVFKPHSTQYMSIVFYHTPGQETQIREIKTLREKTFNNELFTEIQPFTKFYLAEDYHQKYYLQNTPSLMKELEDDYATFGDFINSTATARVNGYVAGYGDATALANELQSLGLSPKGQDKLKSLVK
jgi:peptide-methionine (S)-S-oxide reductase